MSEHRDKQKLENEQKRTWRTALKVINTKIIKTAKTKTRGPGAAKKTGVKCRVKKGGGGMESCAPGRFFLPPAICAQNDTARVAGD